MTTDTPTMHDFFDAACDAADAILSIAGTSEDSFTCGEAEAIAKLLRLTHGVPTADDFIRWHAGRAPEPWGDCDEDDQHHDLYLEAGINP